MIPQAFPPSLVVQLMRDPAVAACAAEAGGSAEAYLRGAFELRRVTLRSGEQMTVATATAACLAAGQSTRILIYRHTPQGYRRVLDDVTLPGLAAVGSDGSVTLPTHESMETIFEATYRWNSRTYIFSDARSHVYDVVLEARRPAEIAVRFTPGSYGTTLERQHRTQFGERYVFSARAGQSAAIELSSQMQPAPVVTLSRDGHALDALIRTSWHGALPATGTYTLTIYGANDADGDRLEPHALKLTIR